MKVEEEKKERDFEDEGSGEGRTGREETIGPGRGNRGNRSIKKQVLGIFNDVWEPRRPGRGKGGGEGRGGRTALRLHAALLVGAPEVLGLQDVEVDLPRHGPSPRIRRNDEGRGARLRAVAVFSRPSLCPSLNASLEPLQEVLCVNSC